MFNLLRVSVPALVFVWSATAAAQPRGKAPAAPPVSAAPPAPPAPPVLPAPPPPPAPTAPSWPGYDQAMTDMAMKNYAVACPRLEEVVRANPNEVTPLMALGECNEGWGRLATGYGFYRRAEQAATLKADAEQLKKAQAKIAEILPRLAQLTLEIPPEVAAIPGVVVNLDRGPLDRQLWGIPLFVDRGEHTLEVQVPGRSPYVRKIPVDVDGQPYVAKANIKLPPQGSPYPQGQPYPYPYPPQGSPWWTQQPKPAAEPPALVKNAQYDKKFSVRATMGGAFFVSNFPSLIDGGGFVELDGLYRARLSPKVRLDLGIEGRYYWNVDASHGKVGVPFEFVFELGRYVELPVAVVPGITFISFDDPRFEGDTAFDIRIQAGLQFILNPRFTLGLSPFSFDFVVPDTLGNMTTFEPRMWFGASF